MKYENIVLNEGTKYPLKGILTLPEGEGKFPAVVFVHGSGSSNMDEKVGKLTPFKDLAEGLAKQGIASIRYDKRSFTHGFKMIKELITVKEETIFDAVAAAELLRQDSRIDSEKIFIAGHSMGAVLAPRIDAEGGNFAGLILMAGSLRKLEEILLYQMGEIMEASPKFTRWILKKQAAKFADAFDGMYDLTDEEAKKIKLGGGTTAYYFKEMGEHPAKEYLEKTRKPILVMQGAMDFQCKKDIDFAAYRELLGDRENVTFRLYEGLNHAFVPALSADISKSKQEYNKERHIGENVITDLANWIKAQ
jgi:dienelactone hydrolase